MTTETNSQEDLRIEMENQRTPDKVIIGSAQELAHSTSILQRGDPAQKYPPEIIKLGSGEKDADPMDKRIFVGEHFGVSLVSSAASTYN